MTRLVGAASAQPTTAVETTKPDKRALDKPATTSITVDERARSTARFVGNDKSSCSVPGKDAVDRAKFGSVHLEDHEMRIK